MEKDNNCLTIVNEDGEEVLCEILFTFDSEEYNKSYVLFYEAGTENDEDVTIMAASYIPSEDDGIGELFDIENDDEWAMIEEVLESFDEECAECEDEDCEHCHHE